MGTGDRVPPWVSIKKKFELRRNFNSTGAMEKGKVVRQLMGNAT